ncbi:MAG: hypothetical protein FJ265_17545 [Planctomycetes bacterium]|nr:hypothetical protein [Planctomycetota bacterium]
MLFCHVTTQVEGDKYPTLLRDKGGRAVPHLVFMDAAGEVLATQGDRSVAGFKKALEGLKQVIGEDPRGQEMVDRLRERLEPLEGGG